MQPNIVSRTMFGCCSVLPLDRAQDSVPLPLLVSFGFKGQKDLSQLYSQQVSCSFHKWHVRKEGGHVVDTPERQTSMGGREAQS